MEPNDVSQSAAIDTRPLWLALQCGPFSMNFDPTTAALREICLGDTEVVKEIAVIVRDRNWGTILPRIEDLRNEPTSDGFQLTFTAHCRQGEIDFAWHGIISGQEKGTLQFRMEGMAHSTFWRNRLGFCTLHPVVGGGERPCIVETVDGERQEGVFPDLISPRQPFRNMRAIRHETLPGIWIDLRFEGDTFEMEDQRNWTDASFKTYSTPLERPFPAEVPAGTRLSQTVTVTLLGAIENLTLPPSGRSADRKVTLQLADAPPVPLPQIGLGVASHGRPLTPLERERLKQLQLSHLRLDLTPSEPGWPDRLRQATEEAQALGAELEIALFPTGEAGAEWTELASALETLQPPIVRWLLFQHGQNGTSEAILRKAREVLPRFTPNARIGGGTNANFAELNRQRPPMELLDGLCYSINPQVHAFDINSLVESLICQGWTVNSALAFSQGLPLAISPITLKPRFNVYATGKEPAPDPGELPPQVDARQSTLFAAGWTLGSLKALCRNGVASVTYYETTGWRGVMETEAGSPLPQAFSSQPGEVFPMFFVFADVGKFAGGEVLPLTSSAPSKVEGMALRAGNRRALLCANLTSDPQQVRFQLPSQVTRLTPRQMDVTNLDGWLGRLASGQSLHVEDRPPLSVTEGMAEWDLPPFAYAHFEWWGD